METTFDRFVGGKFTSVQLTEQLLRRAEQTADHGAFTTLDADRALEAAWSADHATERGPLHGLPLAIKDNIHVAGLANTAGSKALSGFVPRQDAEAILRLRAAGAIVLGKTNMHEFAFGATCARGSYGPVRNPADPARFAGGSSGGTAAAVAAGSAPAGLGTDTGGSVRIPAALTGIVGFRPTTRRYPTGGVSPLSWTRDTIGPMAPSVAGVAILDAVLAGDSTPIRIPATQDLVLAVPEHHFTSPLHPHTETVWEHCLETLRRAGITIKPVRLPEIETIGERVGFPITLYEAARQLPDYLGRVTGQDPALCLPQVGDPDVCSAMREFVLDGAPRKVTDLDYKHALQIRERVLLASYAQIFRSADAVLFPTTPAPAGLIETEADQVQLGGVQCPTFATYIRNTEPGSLAGLPGITVPARRADSGLPVGVALDGSPHTDRGLLGIGLLVEQLLGGGAW